jgi:thymidine kinase
MSQGYLNLIIGPMFSGKSTRLIQYIRKYKILGSNLIVIKPSLDTRYTTSNEICTHNYDKESCIIFNKDQLDEIFNYLDYNNYEIIIIEEGQFFSNLYEIVKRMTDLDKKKVYISALNGDSNRNLFGDIYKLIPLADNIEFLQSLCIECKDGTFGIYSKRITNETSQISVAGNDQYKAVCRKHFL